MYKIPKNSFDDDGYPYILPDESDVNGVKVKSGEDIYPDIDLVPISELDIDARLDSVVDLDLLNTILENTNIINNFLVTGFDPATIYQDDSELNADLSPSQEIFDFIDGINLDTIMFVVISLVLLPNRKENLYLKARNQIKLTYMPNDKINFISINFRYSNNSNIYSGGFDLLPEVGIRSIKISDSINLSAELYRLDNDYYLKIYTLGNNDRVVITNIAYSFNDNINLYSELAVTEKFSTLITTENNEVIVWS